MASAQPVNRPFIFNVLAASADGHIACSISENNADRLALKFTHLADQNHLEFLVAGCDAVFIGARSLASETGAMRVSHLRTDATEPPWVIFSKSDPVNFRHPFWKQKGIRKFSATLLEDSTGDLQVSTKVIQESEVVLLKGNLKQVLSYFDSNNMKRVALLGGATLNGMFWAQDCVDSLHLTVCPFLVGNKTAPGVIETTFGLHKKLELKTVKIDSGLVFLEYSANN